MALSVAFKTVTLNNLIYGYYDTYEYGDLEETECPEKNFIDVSLQFREPHATIAYLRDASAVPLESLHRVLALMGVSGMRPDEEGPRPWIAFNNMFTDFLFDQANSDANYMDCYGAMYSMLVRYRNEPFGCEVHGMKIKNRPFSCPGYRGTCFFCVTSLLQHVMADLHLTIPPEDVLINTEILMDNVSQSVAFAYHLHTLVQNVYVTCAHALCLNSMACEDGGWDENILDGCTQMVLSTKGKGADSTLAILAELKRINCPLTGSIYRLEDNRGDKYILERLVAFNFAIATRVVSGLLAKTVPGASLLMRSYRSGPYSNVRNKLVIRMPTESISVDTIKDVLLAYPSVMLRIGVSGFMMREFSVTADNGFGDVLEKQFYYQMYYEACRADVKDITILPEPQRELRKHSIMELAHQIAINGSPVNYYDYDIITDILRLYQLAIATNFSFSHIRFGNINDTRTFINLVTIPNVKYLRVVKPLYIITHHKPLHDVANNFLKELYNTDYVGAPLDVEIQFIIRFTDSQRETQTILLPKISWDMYSRSSTDNTVLTGGKFDEHRKIVDRVNASGELHFNEWVRHQRRFAIAPINCRSDC